MKDELKEVVSKGTANSEELTAVSCWLSALCCWLLALSCQLITSPSYSQTDSSFIPHPSSFILPSLVPAAVVGLALYENYFDFWKNDNKVPFHISNDPPYALHSDKLGHACYANITADIIKLCYSEAGMDRRTAAWIGAGTAVFAQTLVEIGDGFHGNADYYGFSPGDEAADILGAAFSLSKEYIPYMNRFDYKIGVWPSDAYKQGAFRGVLDDNESQFFWLSYDMHDYMPDWYPKWLNVAIGYGVRDLPSSAFLPDRHWLKPQSLVFLGFDLNLKALPFEAKWWKICAEILSHYRIPFPALQIAPTVKWHWLKP